MNRDSNLTTVKYHYKCHHGYDRGFPDSASTATVFLYKDHFDYIHQKQNEIKVNDFWFKLSGAVLKEIGNTVGEYAYRKSNVTLVFENRTVTKAAAV